MKAETTGNNGTIRVTEIPDAEEIGGEEGINIRTMEFSRVAWMSSIPWS